VGISTIRPTNRETQRQFRVPSSNSSLRVGPPPDRPTYLTKALGDPPSVYGERIRWQEDAAWRMMDPLRSKLAAALCRGLENLPLAQGNNVLYLGAATGTTASHVADLVGFKGMVYAVEKSPRAFQKLLGMAERWPNVAPLLRDARTPQSYIGLVPMVNAIYADIPQVDQVSIVMDNAAMFLSEGGTLLFALKLSSMAREKTSQEHLDDVITTLKTHFRVDEVLPLEPFYRKHSFIRAEYLGTE
jgi:fibrillarin-like pre-rRNA processing protein